jgi:hypothetical protein
MPGVPHRRKLDASLRDMLRTATERPIEIVRAPFKNNDVNQVEDPPYGILYPIPGGGFSGSPLYHPDEDATFTYQVTSVGLRDDQAEWLGDRVREAFLGRDGQGSFVHDLTVDGLAIVSREPTGPPGGLVRNDMLFSVADSYFVRVSAT